MARVVPENDKDIPDKLSELQPGHDEEEGLREALASLRAGQGRPLEEIRATIDASLDR